MSMRIACSALFAVVSLLCPACEDAAAPTEARFAGVADVPLHPCGNGVVEADELCDDGVLNGPDRECTYLCEPNDCELDEQGWCIDPEPALAAGLAAP
ncbi:MAG: hypothetical protein U0168_22230 [Nannocystaceae bacterium]